MNSDKSKYGVGFSLPRIAFLVVFFSLFVACGSPDESPEGKRKQLAQFKVELSELQAKISALEKEVGASPTEGKRLKLVSSLELKPQNFEHFIEAQGNVESEQNVMLNPEFSGIVIKRNFEEGQDVGKGQIIAEIDAETIKRNIAEMQTRYELAKTLYERQEKLWNQKIGSEIQYIQAKNNKESLERSLETMKSQLDKAYIKSPISGTIDQLFVNVGEMANPAMPFARIVNLGQVKIEAEVSETYITRIKKGDKVNIKFPNLNEEMSATISLVGQFINPQNRSFRIRMDIPNSNRKLRPNTLAIVKIKDFGKDNSMVLPSQVIQQSTDGSSYVYILKSENGKNIVRKAAIKVAQSYEGNTLVTEGLQASDKILIKGYNDVVDGEEVQDTPPQQ